MTAPAFQHILYSVDQGVAHILLNRPDRLNALGFGPKSSREEIVAAFEIADRDSSVGCILVSGAGRAFCAGGDIVQAVDESATAGTVYDQHRFYELVSRFNASVRSVQKPTLAAVHGLCLGTAMSFVGQCDIVIAADDTKFGLVEGRLGHPGASELVPLIGAQWTKYLILTGELIDARRAEAIGFTLTTIAADRLLERAIELARRLAKMPREGAVLNKACINNVFDAMGRAAGRIVGRAHDTITKTMSDLAQAPDGRLFSEILRSEGMQGLKRARDQQYTAPWLGDADDAARDKS